MDQNAIKLSNKVKLQRGLLLEEGNNVGKCIKRINLLDAISLLYNSLQKVTALENHYQEIANILTQIYGMIYTNDKMRQ